MIKFTYKQIEILRAIKRGNVDGTPCSVYDLMDKVSYEVKRDAILHSIRVLVEAGLVERRGFIKRKGRPNQVFCITTKALDYI